MKNILTILAVAIATGATAQEIKYDTVGQYGYVDAYMVKGKDTTYRRLCVRGVGDNFVNADGFGSAMLYYEVRLTNGTIEATGNVNMTAAEYKEWNGGNEYPYEVVADKTAWILKD